MSISDPNPELQPCSTDASRPRRIGIGRAWLAVALLFGTLAATLPPLEARAVIIATGDGTGNTTAPAADPGFDNVGRIGVLSGVYLGNGWVLTANHVGANPIELLGVTYDPVPGSGVQLQNPNATPADLMAFKILDAKPPLPDIAITDSAPTLGTDVTMIGHGLNRGVPLSVGAFDGWDWAVGWTMRWGTNEISDLDADGTYNAGTESFAVRFDEIPNPLPDQHECSSAHGDSGGGVFTGSGAGAELIGIMWAQAPNVPNQPQNSSFYMNDSLIADLFRFRTEILALVSQPGCSDGLDDDGDGLVDFPSDPGCANALDTDERGPDHVCDNGLDDDLDGLSDYPNDTTCTSPTGDTEGPLPEPVPTASLGVGAMVVALYAQAHRMLRRTSIDID